MTTLKRQPVWRRADDGLDIILPPFHRHVSRDTWLYTEMVTTGAGIYGNNLNL